MAEIELLKQIEGGWRITLQQDDNESFLITMFNISPDGEELWAVKGVYELT